MKGGPDHCYGHPARESPMALYYLHHCFSQGIPSLLPSIFTPGQFLKKKIASSQDLI